MRRFLSNIFVLVLMLVFSMPSHADSFVSQEENMSGANKKKGFPSSENRLQELLGKTRQKKSKNDGLSARARAMSEAAHTLGFQEGFKNEYEKLLEKAEARRAEFEKIFDFRRLLIDGKVLPPVIRWSGPAMELHSDTDATEVEAQYRIDAPARLVLSPPSYLDYLQNPTEVLEPANEILPSNSGERELWKEEILAGWEEGANHAHVVMDMAFDKLVSDYRGILRFKMLADKGLVSVPILAQGNLGIQVGDNVLNMDQKVFRITIPASFRHLAITGEK